MKQYAIVSLLIFTFSLGLKAQLHHPPIRVPANTITATIKGQAGTKYFNAKHTAKAWLSNTPGKGSH